MRTYIIILSDITKPECDAKFGEFVDRNKLDFWRYTALNWILLTPDDIYTNTLITEVAKAYGDIFNCVLEIDIKDVGGIFPTSIPESEPNNPNPWTPFLWFHSIKDPKFIPRWEKDKDKI